MSKDKKKKGGRSNLNFLFIIGLILAILVIVFAIQNSEDVVIEFFSFKLTPPLALLIIGSILLGSILTLLFSVPGWFSRRKEKSALQRDLKGLRKQYEELASIQKPKAPPADKK